MPRDRARATSRGSTTSPRQDVAGFETYAERMARLCGSGKPNCAMLEDILDGLFHIAKADGAAARARRPVPAPHRRDFPDRARAITQRILARHVDLGDDRSLCRCSASSADKPFDEVRKHYRTLVRQNHPDRLIARGLPEEFITIATTRIAAINAAYEIDRARLQAA